MKAVALLFLIVSGCRTALPCSCDISASDREQLSGVLAMNWDTIGAKRGFSLWRHALLVREAGAVGCDGTIMLTAQRCDLCQDTLVFDQVVDAAGKCAERLSSITLVRTMSSGTTPQQVEESLREVSSTGNAGPAAVGPYGFTRVIEMSDDVTHTIRVDLEERDSPQQKIVRIIVYRTVFK